MYMGASCHIFLLFNWIHLVMAKSGTTPHIKDLFIGRCWQYQILDNNFTVKINCSQLWEAFLEGFAYRDPCHESSGNFTRFFTLLLADSNSTLTNAMFYSGSKDLVDWFTYVNDDYTVLEETLTGFVLDNLKWCGSKTSRDGLNYTHCPPWEDKCSVMYSAWKQASAQFARRAKGTARTLLNASRADGQAYHHGGFFRTYEMPELRVNRLQVFVASNILNPSSETCGTGSLLELERDARKRNITVECIDQPELVLHIFCLRFPRSFHCQQKCHSKPRKWRILGITFSVISVLLLLGLAGSVIRQRVSHKGENYSVQQAKQNNKMRCCYTKADSSGSSSVNLCQSNGMLLAEGFDAVMCA